MIKQLRLGIRLGATYTQSRANVITSVIRQKGESQNGCFKKTKHVKFSEKRTFLTSWYGVRNVRFSENLTCFVFLKHPFWDSPFCLITNDNSLHTFWLKMFFISIFIGNAVCRLYRSSISRMGVGKLLFPKIQHNGNKTEFRQSINSSLFGYT